MPCGQDAQDAAKSMKYIFPCSLEVSEIVHVNAMRARRTFTAWSEGHCGLNQGASLFTVWKIEPTIFLKILRSGLRKRYF